MTSLSIQSLLYLGKAFTLEGCNMQLYELPSPDQPQQPPHRPHPDDEGCKLLDSFAIIVQLALVSSALITLFYKRLRERPQRPYIVW
jgi:hypothetical protein